MHTGIITIGGELGSGKSTVSRLLADELGVARFSTGDLQRSIAAEMGLTSLELNQRAEVDPGIDTLIDNRTVEVAAAQEGAVFDSRLAWFFVPESFKVFLTVDRKLGAERIFLANRGSVEQYASLEDALANVEARRDSEDRRFQDTYGVNPEQLTNYHLVIDTSDVSPERVARQVLAGFEAWGNGAPLPRVWLSPRTPLPTGDVRSLDAGRVRALETVLASGTARSFPAVDLLRVNRLYYVHLGHHAVSAAIRAGEPIFPANMVYTEADALPTGVSASRFVATSCRREIVRAWEEAHAYHYPSYPAVWDTEPAGTP